MLTTGILHAKWNRIANRATKEPPEVKESPIPELERSRPYLDSLGHMQIPWYECLAADVRSSGVLGFPHPIRYCLPYVTIIHMCQIWTTKSHIGSPGDGQLSVGGGGGT